MYPQSSSASRRRTRLGRRGLAVVLVAVGLCSVACDGTTSPGAAAASPGSQLPAALRPGGARYERISQRLDSASPQDRAAFAQCMRDNGVPDFPSTVSLPAVEAAGINLRAASFRSAVKSCSSKLLG